MASATCRRPQAMNNMKKQKKHEHQSKPFYQIADVKFETSVFFGEIHCLILSFVIAYYIGAVASHSMYSLFGTFVHRFVLVGLQPCLEFVVATLFSLGVICLLEGCAFSLNHRTTRSRTSLHSAAGLTSTVKRCQRLAPYCREVPGNSRRIDQLAVQAIQATPLCHLSDYAH